MTTMSRQFILNHIFKVVDEESQEIRTYYFISKLTILTNKIDTLMKRCTRNCRFYQFKCSQFKGHQCGSEV